VFARSFAPIGIALALECALAACAALGLGLLTGRNHAALAAACFLGAASLGVARMHVSALGGEAALTDRLSQQVSIEGTVSAEPDVRDSSVRVLIHATKLIAPVRQHIEAGVLAVLPAHADVRYGQVVHAWGVLQAPEPFDTGSGRMFAYPQYLAAQGITYELQRASAEAVRGASNQGMPLQSLAISVKQAFERGVEAAIPEPEAGLAEGITVGNKRSIGSELSNVFQRVGLVHMVVLSGYNITVVLAAVAALLRRAPRFAQFGGSAFVVAFFVLMAGGAGSAVRAGVMALVAVLARTTHRQFLGGRALGVSAFAIVLWNPFELAFDPSFQLSALATLGLIAFSPLVNARMGWVPERFGMREIAVSTIATQVAVLPLLLYQNGQLPVYTLPANILTLAVIPAAMFCSLVAGIAGVVHVFAVPIGFPAYILLRYVITVAQAFAALPFASLTIGSFGSGWMFGSYALLFGGAWVASLSTREKPGASRAFENRTRYG
jgi:competence protein ComEC